MEFNGISNEIQSGRLFRGEIQEIPSKVLLTFWGGLLIRPLHYIYMYTYVYSINIYPIYIYILYIYIYTWK